MSSERLLAIYDLIATRERTGEQHGLLCTVAAQFIDLNGAGVVLAPTEEPATKFCTSDEISQSLMDFEIIAGEGPYISTNDSEVAVDGSDLVTLDQRWALFSPMATAIGARAVFGFPIRLGVVRLGAMSLYRDSVGELSEDQYADGYLMASVIGRSVLALQSGAQPGELSMDLQRGAMFDFALHQAAGMVSVQGSMPIKDALVAIQSHAFATAKGIDDVAVTIISRRIRYSAPGGTWIEGEA